MSRLFDDGDLRSHCQHQISNLRRTVRNWDAQLLLDTSEQDALNILRDMYSIECPEIDRLNITQEPAKERYRRVQGGLEDDCITGFYSEIVLHVPFSGDRQVFKLRPNHHIVSGVEFDVAVSENELCIFWVGSGVNGELVKQHLEGALNTIETWLSWSRQDIEKHNKEVGAIGAKELRARREQIQVTRQLEESVGFPLHKRADADLHSVPLHRKKISPRPYSSSNQSGNRLPDPVLDDEDYEQVLDSIRNARNALERSPRLAARMGEETIRDLLLMFLNGQFQGTAAGEVFNFDGKTDILVRERDSNVFIGECKIWKGPQIITDTLNQLLGYLAWRDTKASLLLFVRSGNFTDVVNKSLNRIEKHPNFLRRGSNQDFGQRHDYVMSSKRDPKQTVKIAFMPFELPQEPRQPSSQ